MRMKKTQLLAMIQLCIIGLFMSSCESVRCISGVIVDEENHSMGNFSSIHVVRGNFKFYIEYSKEGYKTKKIEYDKWPKNKILVELQKEH